MESSPIHRFWFILIINVMSSPLSLFIDSSSPFFFPDEIIILRWLHLQRGSPLFVYKNAALRCSVTIISLISSVITVFIIITILLMSMRACEKFPKRIILSLSQICTFFNDCGNSNQSLETTSVPAYSCVYNDCYWYFLVASIMFVWSFLCCPNFPGSCQNLITQPFVIDIWSYVVCLLNCFYVVQRKVFSRILFCLLPISDDPSLPQIPTTLQMTKHSANSFWYRHLCELCRSPVFI